MSELPQNVIDDLNRAFNSTDDRPVGIFLCGLAGAGKSYLLNKYAETRDDIIIKPCVDEKWCRKTLLRSHWYNTQADMQASWDSYEAHKRSRRARNKRRYLVPPLSFVNDTFMEFTEKNFDLQEVDILSGKSYSNIGAFAGSVESVSCAIPNQYQNSAKYNLHSSKSLTKTTEDNCDRENNRKIRDSFKQSNFLNYTKHSYNNIQKSNLNSEYFKKSIGKETMKKKQIKSYKSEAPVYNSDFVTTFSSDILKQGQRSTDELSNHDLQIDFSNRTNNHDGSISDLCSLSDDSISSSLSEIQERQSSRRSKSTVSGKTTTTLVSVESQLNLLEEERSSISASSSTILNNTKNSISLKKLSNITNSSHKNASKQYFISKRYPLQPNSSHVKGNKDFGSCSQSTTSNTHLKGNINLLSDNIGLQTTPKESISNLECDRYLFDSALNVPDSTTDLYFENSILSSNETVCMEISDASTSILDCSSGSIEEKYNKYDLDEYNSNLENEYNEDERSSSGEKNISKTHKSDTKSDKIYVSNKILEQAQTSKRDNKTPMMNDKKIILSINSDDVKLYDPRYNNNIDKDTDYEIHIWSLEVITIVLERCCEMGIPFIFQCSGSNSNWLRSRMLIAKEDNFRLALIYKRTNLSVAILRNRDRFAATCGISSTYLHDTNRSMSFDIDSEESVSDREQHTYIDEATTSNLYHICKPVTMDIEPFRKFLCTDSRRKSR